MVELDSSIGCITIADASAIWPELSQFIQNGKIDLGNPCALREYNRAILFGLTGFVINLPNGYLVPAICLRNTYVKFLRETFPQAKTVVDIGTGSSAILALLATHHGFQKVLATELDDLSFESAKQNIMNNEANVKLYKSSGGLIKGVIPEEILSSIDISITYPPFYPSDQPGRTSKKMKGFKGSDLELFGGTHGFEFTQMYLVEAMDLQIPYPSVLLHKKSYAEAAMEILSTSYNSKIVPIKAGTRMRYIVYGY